MFRHTTKRFPEGVDGDVMVEGKDQRRLGVVSRIRKYYYYYYSGIIFKRYNTEL